MNKQEFLARIREGLAGLSQEDIDRSIEFYAEMVDDRMEEGLTEEEAIAAIGSVSDVVRQILSETSLPKLVKARAVPKGRWNWRQIVLLVLGAPLWLSVLLTVACCVLTVYIALWSVVLSLYVADLCIALASVISFLSAGLYAWYGNFPGAFFFAGAGLLCAGWTILFFMGTNRLAKGAAWLSKKILLGIKFCLIGKGNAQ